MRTRWFGAGFPGGMAIPGMLAAGLLSPAAPASAWGLAAHQAVAARVIDTLPGRLKDFYKSHRRELPTLSLEATPHEEGQERRFAVDRLLPFPFADLPRSEAALRERFGPAAEGIGRLPWLIDESYAQLVAAFRAKDKTAVLNASDTLAGLVADLHNPLALADNADGQKTGQPGLWVRFSIKLPEAMGGHLKLSPEAAVLLDDPHGYGSSMIEATYIWLDNLLYLDALARRGNAGYTELYYDALERRAGGILKERLSQAAADAGSYWYTAWTAAGRPDLR